MMRVIDALLPAYESSRGLSAQMLACRVYERDPTTAEVALVDRAAQRLVDRGLADSTFAAAKAERLKVYFRTAGAVARGDAVSSRDHDEGVVIVRSDPLWMVSVIDALLPAYEASRGLSAEMLARRIHGREPTTAEVASVDRAAQRLVNRGLADSTFAAAKAGHQNVYFRAEGAAAPSDPAVLPRDDDESVAIVRSGPLVGGGG